MGKAIVDLEKYNKLIGYKKQIEALGDGYCIRIDRDKYLIVTDDVALNEITKMYEEVNNEYKKLRTKFFNYELTMLTNKDIKAMSIWQLIKLKYK